MTPEAVFALSNRLALGGWVLLAVLPRRRWVAGGLTGVALPLLLAALYAVIVALRFGRGAGSFSTLDGVAALFADRWVLLAGWIHYLAFDLFIGSWQARDAARRGVPHLALLPCLALTFLFGPVGLLLYFAVRAASAGRPA